MFNSLMFYIILGLSATSIALGWLSLSLHDDKVIAVEALRVSQESASTLENSLKLRGLSCQIDSISVVEVEAEKKQIDEVNSPINAKLKDLATAKKAVTPVAPKQETTKDESNFLPDDGLLSPSVTRLLNDGWCATYPDSNQCIPSGQLAGKSM